MLSTPGNGYVCRRVNSGRDARSGRVSRAYSWRVHTVVAVGTRARACVFVCVYRPPQRIARRSLPPCSRVGLRLHAGDKVHRARGTVLNIGTRNNNNQRRVRVSCAVREGIKTLFRRGGNRRRRAPACFSRVQDRCRVSYIRGRVACSGCALDCHLACPRAAGSQFSPRTLRRRFTRIFTWINNQPLSGRMYGGTGEADGQIAVAVTSLECQARSSSMAVARQLAYMNETCHEVGVPQAVRRDDILIQR